MSPDPYENEPGFEEANSDYDKKLKIAYTAKVRLSRLALTRRIEAEVVLDPP